MTLRQGTYGRDIVARGRALAEQRLAHLTELLETGRWRRYHSEHAFLENLGEAKQLVQVWQKIAAGGDPATRAAPPEPSLAATARGGSPSELVHTVQPKSVHIDVETSVPVSIASVAGGPIHEPAIAQVTETAKRVPELSLVIDNLKDRYPLLRNTF